MNNMPYPYIPDIMMLPFQQNKLMELEEKIIKLERQIKRIEKKINDNNKYPKTFESFTNMKDENNSDLYMV